MGRVEICETILVIKKKLNQNTEHSPVFFQYMHEQKFVYTMITKTVSSLSYKHQPGANATSTSQGELTS